MTRVVVLEKVYGPHRPEDFTPAFLTLCSGLSVRVRVTGTIGHGWLVLNVSGEDEEVAIRLLDEEIGLAPVEASRIKRFSTIRGKISSFGPEGIHVDIGVVEPHELTALVRPEVLRAQLADGQDVDVPALAILSASSSPPRTPPRMPRQTWGAKTGTPASLRALKEAR